MNFKRIPVSKYHKKTDKGPYQPTSSDNFLEKRIISKVGFEKLEYISERD
jgi:hypothetical protein